MKNASFAAIIASVYAVVYCVLIQIPDTVTVAMGMFLFSPILLIWMVYTILRHGKYKGPELAESQEYGYQDRVSRTK